MSDFEEIFGGGFNPEEEAAKAADEAVLDRGHADVLRRYDALVEVITELLGGASYTIPSEDGGVLEF